MQLVVKETKNLNPEKKHELESKPRNKNMQCSVFNNCYLMNNFQRIDQKQGLIDYHFTMQHHLLIKTWVKNIFSDLLLFAKTRNNTAVASFHFSITQNFVLCRSDMLCLFLIP